MLNSFADIHFLTVAATVPESCSWALAIAVGLALADETGSNCAGTDKAAIDGVPLTVVSPPDDRVVLLSAERTLSASSSGAFGDFTGVESRVMP
ncbi:MAG: hypothetical protein ACLQBA_04180 [Candidatus Binataceae bacterium]